MDGSKLALGAAGALALAAAAKRARREGPGSAARVAIERGPYRYVHNCTSSTYEDIRKMLESAVEVSRNAFARAVGPDEWKSIQQRLGYGRDFPISRDWHVSYDKGTYRGVPAYWLTHSHIEYIFTLNGEVGPSARATMTSIPRGTLLYHGTSAEDDFDELTGPAWVSDSESVAREFVTWAGGAGPSRVLTFEVVREIPAIALVASEADMNRLRREVDPEEEAVTPIELAELVCGEYNGWHIPNNYPSGSDTMLCEPGRWLKLVHAEVCGSERSRKGGGR